MSDEIEDAPGPDPDAIAAQSFTKSRKGYEIDEVRAYLVQLSSQLREAQRVQATQARRLAELERRGTDHRELDEDQVTQMLGEETARVLDTARKAANEIRTKAQEAADEQTGAADAQATATREAAAQYDHETRTAADDYSAGIRAATDDEIDKLRTAVAAEVAQLRDEAERVLSERTAEAETAAAEVRAEGDAYRAQVAGDADSYAAETRAAADSYREETHGAAEGYAADLRAQADAALQDARAEAESTRAATDAAAARGREQAEEDAEAIREAARQKGREMVEEARTYRERVIADLADRRRQVRAQLEELLASRDALAVALTDVAGRIDASHKALAEAVIDPRDLGDVATDRAALADDAADDAFAPPEAVADEPPAPQPEPEPAPEAPAEPAAEAPYDIDVDEADDVAEPAAEAPADPVEALPVEAIEDEPVEIVDLTEPAEPEADELDAGAPTEVVAAVPAEDPADAVFAKLKADVPEAAAGDTVVETQVDTEVETEVEAKDDPDTDLLDLRDATVDELERALARRLKRVLADEQNEALDRLRRVKGAPTIEAVLLSEHEDLSRYQAAALEDLVAAERAGASFFTDAPVAAVDVSDVAHEFATDLVRALRGRLEAAFDEGGDEYEVGERIRACYREWKTQRIAEVATHYVLVAFGRGVAGAGSGGSARWLVDDGGHPCPDCDDNALAGAVPSGEEFPTGDLHPPAHPGCRCLAVPV